MVKIDVKYVRKGLYTAFIPVTTQGETLIREMMQQHGSNDVLRVHEKSTINQIRRAGYYVSKAKQPTKKEMNAVLKEFEETFTDSDFDIYK